MPYLPLLTGLILFFSGIVIGYLFSFRDRSDHEAINENLTQERDRLSQELETQREESVHLSEQLNKKAGKLQFIEELCQNLDASKRESDQQLSELQAELSAQRSMLDESRTRLNLETNRRVSLEDKLHEMKQGHIESLATVQNNWREKLANKDAQIGRQEKEVDRLQATCLKISEKLQRVESHNAELESSLANQQHLLQTATVNASGLEKEYVSLESSLKHQNELLDEARGKAAAAISAKELAEEALREMREQIESYQARLGETERLNRELDHAQQRCGVLEETLENSNGRLVKMSAERDAAISAEQQALSVIGGLRKRTENQESTIRRIRVENEQAAIKVQMEKSARHELETTLEQKQQQFQMRLSAYTEIETRIEDLDQELAEKSAALKELQSSTYTELKNQTNEFQVRLEHLVKQRDQALTERNELQGEMKRLRSMCRRNEETIRNLRRERGAVLLRNRQPAEKYPRLLKTEFAEAPKYEGQTRRDPVLGIVFTKKPETVDDLKQISGIAYILEKRLNDFGIFTYRQIMEWNPTAIAEFSNLLTFKDRIERDDWQGQARDLYQKKYGKLPSYKAG